MVKSMGNNWNIINQVSYIDVKIILLVKNMVNLCNRLVYKNNLHIINVIKRQKKQCGTNGKVKTMNIVYASFCKINYMEIVFPEYKL